MPFALPVSEVYSEGMKKIEALIQEIYKTEPGTFVETDALRDNVDICMMGDHVSVMRDHQVVDMIPLSGVWVEELPHILKARYVK